MPKNTVVFMSDEHNPRYSSVYGHPFVQTPNMARLAARGTTFENAYCPSPLCMPSRSAFTTGKRVHETQVYSNCLVNTEFDYPSYGRALAEQGVHTVHVGDAQFYNDPHKLGFSEMFPGWEFVLPGDTAISRTPLAIRKDAASRADRFGPAENPFDKDLKWMNEAVTWLRTKAPSLKTPWTLCIGLVKPHFPHFTTQELWDMYEGHDDLPEHDAEAETAQHPYMQDLRRHFLTDGFTEDQVRGLRRGYYGCVTFLDRQLGRLVDTLEETRILDETNIIYTADHGEMLGKFGMWWKCTLLDAAARIPLIAAGPDFEAGAEVKTPVDLLDVQASMFRSVGAERPDNWHGEPLQDIPADDPKRVVFSEYHGHGTRSGAFMIRKGDWKLIFNMDGPHQLFDIVKDSEELSNVYEAEADKAAELEAELRAVCDPEAENEKAHAFEKRQLETLAATREGGKPDA